MTSNVYKLSYAMLIIYVSFAYTTFNIHVMYVYIHTSITFLIYIVLAQLSLQTKLLKQKSIDGEFFFQEHLISKHTNYNENVHLFNFVNHIN